MILYDNCNKKYKIPQASVGACLYVISKTKATFEASLIKNLSNTEAELKKCVAHKKACKLWFI